MLVSKVSMLAADWARFRSRVSVDSSATHVSIMHEGGERAGATTFPMGYSSTDNRLQTGPARLCVLAHEFVGGKARFEVWVISHAVSVNDPFVHWVLAFAGNEDGGEIGVCECTLVLLAPRLLGQATGMEGAYQQPGAARGWIPGS
jgi:hypothetical protein